VPGGVDSAWGFGLADLRLNPLFDCAGDKWPTTLTAAHSWRPIARLPYLIEQNYAAYTEEQQVVWAELVGRRMRQLAGHAAAEYLEGLAAIGLRTDAAARLPDVAEITARLKPTDGLEHGAGERFYARAGVL
jgi:phenylalanine-4-hydroxylase